MLMLFYKAATRSIRMFESLPDVHRWNTFVAIMRREGEWKDTDFNDELTEGIFPDVVKWYVWVQILYLRDCQLISSYSSWNRVMNRCIPSLLKRYRRVSFSAEFPMVSLDLDSVYRISLLQPIRHSLAWASFSFSSTKSLDSQMR